VPPCRYRVRGCAIVGICDVVGRVVISYAGPRYRTTRRGIVHTRVIVSATRDIVGRDRISPRAPTISRVALTITRVGTIPRPGHDIVRKRTILQRGPAISRAPTISRPAHDIAHTHVNTIAARYRTRVVISWAGSRYRAGTISWARPRYRGISRYRAPAQDNARYRKVLCLFDLPFDVCGAVRG